MILSFFDNDYVKVILVFVLSILFLVVFSFCATLATKISQKKKYRKMDDKDKTERQSKIYELIYSKNTMKLEEFSDYFNCEQETIAQDLKEMCNNNIIKEENGTYSIKR